MEPLQKDWFDYIVGISQVVVAIATVAAGLFAGAALKENRRDRIEREKPYLAAKAGEYVEGPIPSGIDHPSFNELSTNPANEVDIILFNAGNGPVIDLSLKMEFKLTDKSDKALIKEDKGIFTGEGVIAVGDHLATEEIISQINFFLYDLDQEILEKAEKQDSMYDFSLALIIVALYRDRGMNYYTQTFRLSASIKVYQLLKVNSRTLASDYMNSKDLAKLDVKDGEVRIRKISFYYVTPSDKHDQIEVSTLPKQDHRRWYIENRFKSPDELKRRKWYERLFRR